MVMKKIEENLSIEEFDNYCMDICNNMESVTTYYGQFDEVVPFSESLKKRHVYGEENDEHEVIFYEEIYNDRNLIRISFLPVGRRTGESHLCEDNEP